jgi:hypothetical protein
MPPTSTTTLTIATARQASIASMMKRVMIQAERTLLDSAQREAHERGVSFPQFVREALERELQLSALRPAPLTCVGVISTGGRAGEGTYEPDPWR